ncbi:MAG: DNA polymerase III subunit beta [Deltaproteobacteria bacterium]|nr:DNA polymerase III subunit beta [Deltaproteobacteria bacterium]
MKLTIDREELLRGLGRIQAVVERRGALPILSNVLIDARSDGLAMSATDLEVGVVSEHAAQVEEVGAITLGARKLHDLVREFEEPEVRIRTEDSARVGIECGSSRIQLLSISPEEYPTLPSAEGVEFVEIEASLLGEMIDATLYAASNDEARYNLNGVYMELSEGKLVLVATNGHRLAKIERTPPAPVSFLEKGITVPRKGVAEIRKLCDETEGSVEIGLGEGFLLVRTDRLVLSCRLIDGDFPDYRQVIPSGHRIRIMVDRERLVHAVRRLSILAHERSGGFKMALEDGSLLLSASNADLGEGNEEIPIDYTGDRFETGFNARYVLDALSSVVAKEIAIELSDDLSAAKLRPADDPDQVGIIMPMRA